MGVWTKPGSDWKPPPLGDIRAHVLSEINITNFQSAAIFTGLVDAIVWLRSDFELGRYNSPAPGHYRRLLGLPDYSREDSQPDLGVLPAQISDGGKRQRPLLCLWDLDPGPAGGAFHDYGDF